MLQKHRKSLAAMVCHPHKDDSSNPSSHTTYGNLHMPEKDARLSHLHQENRKAKLHIIRLEQKISLAANEDGVKLDEELHSDIMNLVAST